MTVILTHWCRYNGGEGFVPGSMFRKFDRRQGTAYVKNIRRKFHARKSTRIIPTMKPKWMNDSTASSSSPSPSGNLCGPCVIVHA
ncbi:hypothetical protein GBAR_LOCUS24424 [Geodia barretti]|uniref:Uncharacterized protein n=1 Tax=Geodia barretti TaxID=519541 RepID=A0AA35TBR3_GEOBA|nr:hypothetical protein GBAR_LOCUS24424 [Geodia barretti]